MHLLGDQVHAALQTVTRGQSRSLRRRANGLVCNRTGQGPAAGAAGDLQGRMRGMWIMVIGYLILLLLFPSTVLFLSALSILVLVGGMF